MQFWLENLRRSDNFGDLYTGERIIFKTDF